MPAGNSRRARAGRRRQRRMKAALNDLTRAEWLALCAAWAGCAYCGHSAGSMQRDCVLPLSRGGRYTWRNVVPACRACNASKGNAEVTGWVRRKGLDESRFLLRHASICADLAAAFAADSGRLGAQVTG